VARDHGLNGALLQQVERADVLMRTRLEQQRSTQPLGLVRLHRIVPGIVPVNQSLYKL
jgi:hypothetical protein